MVAKNKLHSSSLPCHQNQCHQDAAQRATAYYKRAAAAVLRRSTGAVALCSLPWSPYPCLCPGFSLTVRAAALLLTILVRPSSSLTLHQVLDSDAYQNHNFLKEHICVANNNINMNNCNTFFEKTEKKNPCALMMLLTCTHVEEWALSLLGHFV